MKILAHSVPMLESGLSPMQEKLLESDKYVRLVDAPTGSGKSYAFVKSAIDSDKRILFIVPTKRLLQNLINDAGDQARNQLRGQGWSEDRIELWVQRRIIEWSGNQTPEDNRGLAVLRASQVKDPQIKIIFAIPEVVVSMLSGLQVRGGTAVNPFMYMRWFDHIVFDEFHTIDDRSFGLSCLLALLACNERKGKVTLLSATPVNIIDVLEGVGVKEHQIDIISERVVDGHPKGSRPIHGDVEISRRGCSLLEAVENGIDLVLESIANGYTVILIYDSLKRLKKEEQHLRDLLQNFGISDSGILTMNSIDDSEREPGRSRIGHVYRDPRDYSVLICTSSVEVGVSFKSNLMLMEPGFSTSNFIQRIGRVSRGEYAGKVIVSCPANQLNRHRWIRRVAVIIDGNEILGVETFTSRVLSEVRQKLEPNTIPRLEETSIEFYRKASWRGSFWAGLFIEAIISTKMKVQMEARERIKKLRGKKVKLISAKIGQIMRVDIVNDNIYGKAQPHKEWINALYVSALTYRDIGATITVIDPNGISHTVLESFLRRNTSILRRYIQEEEEGHIVIRLRKRTLDQEIRDHSDGTGEHQLRLYVRSPIGGPGFSVLIRDRERTSEYLSILLVREWKANFSHLLSKSGRSSNSHRNMVMRAATDLVELLGKPPLEEDYEDISESAIFA